MNPSDVSVILPTRNEESEIQAAIESAKAAGAKEIIVADGGSSDHTVSIAQSLGVAVVNSDAGRGTQLNSGLQLATREFVLFLHADNRLGENCLQQICDSSDCVWGAFQQAIQCDGVLYRWLEKGNAARVRWRKMPFGDQAIFANRSQLLSVGGVPEIPLMEDVDLSRRLRRVASPVLLPGPIEVNSRRWQQRGIVRQTALNWTIQMAYACGASPERLTQWYRS